MKFLLAVGGWMMGCGLLVAQTPTSTRWHLPLDSAAWNVRLASDSAGVMVPSVQPMASWNRPAALQPQFSVFEGLAVVGEARQIVGDFFGLVGGTVVDNQDFKTACDIRKYIQQFGNLVGHGRFRIVHRQYDT